MPTHELWVLGIHVAAGAVAVLAGLAALATTKGGLAHRRAGRVFVWAMAIVVVTVFGLTLLDATRLRIILSLVAIFSGYLAFSGYRVLARKRPPASGHPVDWAVTMSVVIACLALGGWGIVLALGGDSFGVVMVVFGGIGSGFGAMELRQFRSGAVSEWRVAHLQRMIAAFIATVSAVSAVNLASLGALAWLWPTIVGSPLIYYYSSEESTPNREASGPRK